MSDHRIDDLRRRVEADPMSIAFAALAEEYRRAGEYEEAVAVCRNGLTRHPAYLSARVTLGRALLELNELDSAQAELEHVLKIAPENLAAIRSLGEVRARLGAHVPTVLPASVLERAGSTPFELDLMPVAPEETAGRTVLPSTILEGPAPNRTLSVLDRFLDAIVTLKHISA